MNFKESALFSANKKIALYKRALIMLAVSSICLFVVRSFDQEIVSDLPLIVLSIFAFCSALGIVITKYRLQHGYYGTNKVEARQIIQDLSSINK